MDIAEKVISRLEAIEERLRALEDAVYKKTFEVDEAWIAKEAKAMEEDRRLRETEKL